MGEEKKERRCPTFREMGFFNYKCGAKIIKKTPALASRADFGQFTSEGFLEKKYMPEERYKEWGFGGRTDPKSRVPMYIYMCEKGHFWIRPDWWADVPVVSFSEIGMRWKKVKGWEWAQKVYEEDMKRREKEKGGG